MVSTFRADEADGIDKAMVPGIDHGAGSQITTQDWRTGDQHLPVANTSTSIPGHESDDASEYSRPLPSEPIFISLLGSTAAAGEHIRVSESAERAIRSQ